MTKEPYLRAYLWLLLTVCCSFTIAACNNPNSSDNAARKNEDPNTNQTTTLAASSARPSTQPRQISPSTGPFAEIEQIGRALASSIRREKSTEFSSMSGDVLDAFIPAIPELAKHRVAIEKSEREVIRGAMEQFKPKLDEWLAKRRSEKKADAPTEIPHIQPHAQRTLSHTGLWNWAADLDFLTTTAHAQSIDAGSLLTSINGLAITQFLGEACDQGKIPPNTDLSSTKSVYKDDKGSAKIEVTRESDSTPTISLESTIAVPLFMLEANSRLALTASAMCPDESGKVQFKVKLGKAGRAGSSSMIYDQNREATVTAYVDDNAKIASADMQTQYSERSTAGGRQVYVEASTSWHVNGNDWGHMTVTDHHLVRASSQATNDDLPLIGNGLKQSLALAQGALLGAESRWQSGACIKINATSPGTVKPKATSKIPVSVTHRKEGTDLPAKVTVELSGGDSVSPSVIPKAPGDVTHVAVDKDGAAMSIKLTATSKRGMAEEMLKINTVGMVFKLDGGADEFHGTGIVCDFEKPFKVKGDGLTVTFTPNSKSGGTYKYSGKLQGFEAWGKGTYTVQYNGDDPVHVTAKGPGTVKTPMGDMTADGTEEYSVSASQSGCPYDKLLLD